MTNHKDLTSRSGRIGWWLTGRFRLSLLIGGSVLTGYLALPFVDSPKTAQSASEAVVAAGPTMGYVVDTRSERRLAEEHPTQTYTDWLRAAHADAALHGQNAPLPDQF